MPPVTPSTEVNWLADVAVPVGVLAISLLFAFYLAQIGPHQARDAFLLERNLGLAELWE